MIRAKGHAGNLNCSDRKTRSYNYNNVDVPYESLECFKNAFALRGPVIGNDLPDVVKECHNLYTF